MPRIELGRRSGPRRDRSSSQEDQEPLRGRELLAIGLAALLLRLAHLLALREDPLFSAVVGDSQVYVARAHAMLRGEVADAHAFTAPLYPVLLSLLFRVAGEALELVRWLQSGLGVVAACATGAAAASLWGRRAGLVAGLLLAASPVAIFFDGELLSASPVLALVAVGVWMSARSLAGGGPAVTAGAGAAFGVAALGQPQAAVFVLGAVPAALGRAPRGRRAAALAAGALAVLVLGSVVQRWTSGHWVGISAGGGVNLAIGNHPGASGGFELPPGSGLENSSDGLYPSARSVAESATGDAALGPVAVSRFWTGRTLAWMRAEPVETVRLFGRKLLLAINHYEIPNHYDIDFFRPRSPVLGWNPVLFAWLGPLGLAGILGLAGKRDRAGPWLLLSSALYLAVLALFFVTARYRLLVWPYLALGAAGAIELAVEAVRTRAWARLTLLGGTATVLAVLSVVPGHPRFSPAHMQLLLSDVLAERGDAEGARRALEKAASSRELHAASHDLGNAYYREGRYAEALSEYRNALELDPGATSTLLGIGLCELELGRPREAAVALELAARHAPDDPRVLQALERTSAAVKGELSGERPRLPAGKANGDGELGTDGKARALYAAALADARAGRRDSARARFRRVLALRPGDAGAHLNLALLAELDGDLETAERELADAAALGAEDHPERLIAAARIAVRRGDLRRARALCERAEVAAPDDPRTRAVLDALERLEREAEAGRQRQ